MKTQEADILRYLDLLDRRMYIILHSGVGWRPEYGPELERIDQELVQIRDDLGLDPIKKALTPASK